MRMSSRGWHPLGIGLDAPVADHEAQELAGRDTEDALLWIKFPAVDTEVGEGLREVSYELVRG